ncbi:uncharacterized protein LOC126578430 [Anopheles aquasalis]|uniref:uncharacterized protein LOC126578430 n=1 Tax=Anopheles aquasalis TaxID=42839 RepID=UPI00215B73BE|nr:uncharacterized protein LOC126578430 [Anopheles aquasalis]
MNRDEELEAWKELYRELLQVHRDYKSRCTCHMKTLTDGTEEIEGMAEKEQIEVIEETEGIEDIEETVGIEDNEIIEVIEEAEGFCETVDIDELERIHDAEGFDEVEGIHDSEEIDEIGIEETLDDISDCSFPTYSKEELPPDPGRSEANRLLSYAPPKLPVCSVYELQCLNNYLKTEQGKTLIRKTYFKHVPAKHVIVDIFFERNFLTKIEFSKAHYSRQVVLKKFPDFLNFFCELNKEFYDFSPEKTEKRMKGTLHRARRGLRK